MELSRRRTITFSGLATVSSLAVLAGCGDGGPGDEETENQPDDEQADHPDDVESEGPGGTDDDAEPTGGVPEEDDENESEGENERS